MKKTLLILLILFLQITVNSQTNLLYKTYSANYPCYGGSNVRPLTDVSGNVYFFYCFYDSANFQAPNGNHLIQTGPMYTGDQDILVLKMDPNGNILFKGSIGGIGTNVEALSAAAINQNNELLVAIQSSEATIDVDPGPAINNVVNPMQLGATGHILIRYDSNFNVLNTYTQFSAPVSFITSTQNNWLIHFVIDPGTNADIDITAGTQNVSNLSGTNMQTKVVGKYNASGTYISDFRFQQGNTLTMGIYALTTEMHSNTNGETFLVGVCDDSVIVNTMGGPLTFLPGNGVQSNIFYMKLNASMQCVYYKNLTYDVLALIFPMIQGDDAGNAYIAIPQDYATLDLDPGPALIQPNLPNAMIGISKYDANGNYLNHICFSNASGIGNHFGNLFVDANKILFTLSVNPWNGPCIAQDATGLNNVLLTPNYDDFPMSVVMDTAFQVITFFTTDTLSGNGNYYQNFGGQITPNGILWTMYTHDWLDTDFGPGFDTIPANSLAFVSINGGQFAGANTAEGKIYFDLDLSSSFSVNDLPVPYRFVKTSSNNYLGLSDSSGNYKLYLPNGTHTYSTGGNVPLYYTINPSSNSSVFAVSGSTDINKDFKFSPTLGIHDLQVFQLATSAHRPGFPASYSVYVNNVGTSQSNYTLKVTIDTVMKSISTIPPFTQQNGDTLIWTGLNLNPMKMDYFLINSTIDPTTPIGDTLIICSDVQDPLEITPADNSLCDSVIASAAYDPNYKEVNWGNSISTVDMGSLPWFYYTVHFQNTGNDTAFNIHVIDTVRQYFDLSSFELLHASHPCQPVYLGNSILDFKFQNILLPDSTTNEPLSHGQVSYRIKPSQNWPAGTVLQNGAAIYFDFNLPVITAPMLTTVVAPVGLSEFSTHSNDVLAYPNPGTGLFRIQSKNEVEKVVVYNLMGQNVATADITGKEKTFDLDLRHLENGIYIANIFNNGKASIVKVIVQH